MTIEAIITICIIVIAIILFASEVVRIDLIALLIIVALVVPGVLTPEEGISGFSNPATITVAFMFVLSAAVLKTGALQFVAFRLSRIFRKNFNYGMVLMMLMIAVISAFINNTPVVAVFIPVVIQIAKASGQNPNKMLIPLSFASIFGGTCTLVGTSTNLLVSGIAEKQGLEPISMFQMTPLGLVFLAVGILYMMLGGIKLIPAREEEEDLEKKFGIKKYISEVELVEDEEESDERMDPALIRELDVDILEVRRGDKRFSLPSEDFMLEIGDVLKIRCDAEKIKKIKKWARLRDDFSVKIGDVDWEGKGSSLVEMIITVNSEIKGKKLGEVDFKGRFRAVPLAVKQRKGIMNENLSDITLHSGDVILAEVKSYYIKKLHEMENEPDAPFAVLSEDRIISFDKKNFFIVMAVIVGVILTASLGILDILTAAITGVALLVLLKILDMKEMYKAIDWQVVFLLAGALSLGTAFNVTGLDVMLAEGLLSQLGRWGPVAVVSGIYIVTTLLTNLMTNNAAAALLAPIAIATASSLDVSAIPFLMAIAFAGSASFMTPIGYQTNTMVYSAGRYKFMDFVKVGTILNVIFWIIATFLIPFFYGF